MQKYRFGFTLMELMVAVALLVGVILAVGMVFQGTSKAVSLSQSTSEAFAGVRSLSKQIEKDVSSLDRDGFLIIRSRVDTVDNTRRFDQISFLAKGSFRNLTGSVNANPFTDRSVGNAAHVWYGQLVIAADGTTVNGTPYTDESVPVPLAAIPTGVKDQDFVLGRHTTVLFPDDGSTSGTYSSVTSNLGMPIYAFRRDTTNVIRHNDTNSASISSGLMPDSSSSTSSDITSSRVAAAGYTPSFLMGWIRYTAGARSITNRFEANNFCYRFRALPNIWATASATNSAINGYYRMHPIFLSGVPSFRVDWTDGSTNAAGVVNWFGYGNSRTSAVGAYPPAVLHTEPTPNYSDDYVAQFSFDNKPYWPKALRFTYRVTDPQDRLGGGRTFVQVVSLPQ